MKDKIKKLLIVACAVFVFGIILGGIGFVMGGSSGFYLDQDGFHAANNNSELKVIELEPYHNIEVNMRSASVELIKSDHNAVEYQLMQTETLGTCAVQNGTLVINQKHQIFLSFFYFNSANYIKIYYKDDCVLENIHLETTSGQVKAYDVQGKDITLRSTSGSVKVSHIKSDCLILKSTSGSVHAEHVDVLDMTASTVSGRIEMLDMKTKKLGAGTTSGRIQLQRGDISDITASTISGRIEMLDMKTKGLEASTTSGSIQLQGSFEGNSNVHSTSGSVKFDNALLQSQCNYKLDSLSGSIRVNDENFEGTVDMGAPNRISIETTSGSIRLNFIK